MKALDKCFDLTANCTDYQNRRENIRSMVVMKMRVDFLIALQESVRQYPQSIPVLRTKKGIIDFQYGFQSYHREKYLAALQEEFQEHGTDAETQTAMQEDIGTATRTWRLPDKTVRKLVNILLRNPNIEWNPEDEEFQELLQIAMVGQDD